MLRNEEELKEIAALVDKLMYKQDQFVDEVVEGTIALHLKTCKAKDKRKCTIQILTSVISELILTTFRLFAEKTEKEVAKIDEK